jgi:magnesium chelatase family protein
MDRIDLHVDVPVLKFQELDEERFREDSKAVKRRVKKARRLQQKRYQKYGIRCNAELSPKLLKKYCRLDSKARSLLERAFIHLGMTARAYVSVLKIARTIADLEESEKIKTNHIAEAIQYRTLDKAPRESR